jgi:hypothetical protein
VEALKVQFWYPREYFDQPLPLRQVGEKGAKWLAGNPDAVVFPGNVMTKLGWSALLFDPSGLEFFDKKALVENTRVNWTPLAMGRIWEHAHAIEWLKSRGDFQSKGIITELKALVEADVKIQSPERSVEETSANRYRLSKHWRSLQKRGDRHYGVKMREAGLNGEPGEDFHRLWDHLKSHFWGDSPVSRR